MSALREKIFSEKEEFSLVRESLNIYLQNKNDESVPCMRELWPNNILKDDFLGKSSQQKDYILALLSQGAYYDDWQKIQGVKKLNKTEIFALGVSSDLLNDELTGFQANICRFNNLYILCFSGSKDIIDFYSSIRQGLGFYEPQYFQAVGLMNVLSNAVNGNTICTGHSLGGGLSSIAALSSQSPCIAFSPAGLSKNTINNIGINYHLAKKIAREGLIRFYTVQYDWLDILQNSLPIPSALGNRIKMAYSEQNSWKNWLPHRLLTRGFIAHTILKIINVMCKYKPWNNWNAVTGEFNKVKEGSLEIFPNKEEIQSTNWQECCKNAIKRGNVAAFSELLTLKNKPCDIDCLALQSASALNGQFMKILIGSQYGETIKEIRSKNQKSILHLAAQNGRFMQSQVLLKNGLLVDVKDNLGNTPLHDALNSHALDIAVLLLECGADWRIKNNQGINCKDILGDHIIKDGLLNREGKKMREKVFQMMH